MESYTIECKHCNKTKTYINTYEYIKNIIDNPHSKPEENPCGGKVVLTHINGRRITPYAHNPIDLTKGITKDVRKSIIKEIKSLHKYMKESRLTITNYELNRIEDIIKSKQKVICVRCGKNIPPKELYDFYMLDLMIDDIIFKLVCDECTETEIKTKQDNKDWKLIEKVLAVSVSKSWSEAVKEWKIVRIYRVEDPLTCTCSHYPINNITIVANDNGDELIIGSCCIKIITGRTYIKEFNELEYGDVLSVNGV